MKTLEIGNQVFEVIRSKYTENMITYHDHDYLGRKTLYDFYKNPSVYKEQVWRYWQEWAAQNYPVVGSIRVTGASCFAFSIGAYYCDPETYEILGYFKITQDHNRLYLLK